MSASKFELFRRHWLWSILVTGITLFITIYNAYLQHRSAQHEMGGSLMATYYQRSLDNSGARTIVVCMDDANVNLNGLYVTPTLDNPREFSIKDFSLSIKATCSNVELVPSSLVETHEYGGGEWLYKYKDNLLAAHDDTKRIFTDYKVSGNTGYCLLETKASYDGAATAVEYNTNVWFLVVPRKSAQSFEQWKINCKKRLLEVVSDKYYDVFYYSRTNNVERHFDIALVDNDNVADKPLVATSPSEPVEVKKIPTTSSTTPTPTISTTYTTTKEKARTVSKPVEVKPANNNQDVNIVKYSSSKKGKHLTIKYKLDKKPIASGNYLLYATYTVPDNDNNYVFTIPVKTQIGVEEYTHHSYAIDSLLHHVKDLRILKETDAKDAIVITHSVGRRVIKNATKNKIAVVVYSSGNTYRNYVLEKSEVIYDIKGNDGNIHVFDTGEKSTKEVKSESESDSGLKAIIILILFSILAGTGIICILVFISELQDTRSIKEAFYSIYGLDAFKEVPFYEKILYAIFLISPIFAIIFVVKIIFKIAEPFL